MAQVIPIPPLGLQVPTCVVVGTLPAPLPAWQYSPSPHPPLGLVVITHGPDEPALQFPVSVVALQVCKYPAAKVTVAKNVIRTIALLRK